MPLSRLMVVSLVTLLVSLGGWKRGSAQPPAPPAPPAAAAHSARPEGVAWFEGNLAQALSTAGQQHKPVFLYFGASWCPPCQELKATVFRRQDFLAKLSLFVPVYLDGDAPEAQRWASEFKVTGYPTVLILGGGGVELQRVSGGMDLGRYSEVLDLGLSATRPISGILAAVAAGPAPLSAADCRRLAYNGWSLQEEWIYREDHPGWFGSISDALTTSAQRCPAGEAIAKARLDIVALAAALEAESVSLTAGDRPSARVVAGIGRVRAILEDQALATSLADTLEYLDAAFFRAVARLDPAHAAALEARWFTLMDAISQDPRYSVADHLYTLNDKITAARALEKDGKVPPALAAEARERIAAALALRTDDYTRTSLVNAALNALEALDDQDRRYALLTAELQTSRTPYYYMSDLADIEEKRGHTDAAISWLARSYRESAGSATRFQWGVRYVRGLLRLRPEDEATIRDSTREVLAELEGAGRIYGRSSAGLNRLARSLHAWNGEGTHAAVMEDIRTRMDGICGKLPAADPARATCARFLQTL